MTARSVEERRLRTLERRAEFLEKRERERAREAARDLDWDRQEATALRWAVRELRARLGPRPRKG